MDARRPDPPSPLRQPNPASAHLHAPLRRPDRHAACNPRRARPTLRSPPACPHLGAAPLATRPVTHAARGRRYGPRPRQSRPASARHTPAAGK